VHTYAPCAKRRQRVLLLDEVTKSVWPHSAVIPMRRMKTIAGLPERFNDQHGMSYMRSQGRKWRYEVLLCYVSILSATECLRIQEIKYIKPTMPMFLDSSRRERSCSRDRYLPGVTVA
jgi:hypothetical protein